MSYSSEEFKWCDPRAISRDIIDYYMVHYKSLDKAQLVGILFGYIKEAVRLGYVGAVSAGSVITLILVINNEFDGKFPGGDLEHNLFILDFCKKYADLIYSDRGCVSIW